MGSCFAFEFSDGFVPTPRELVLGFRAEEARMSDASDQARLSATVEHVELLGTEKLLSTRIGDNVFRVRLPVGQELSDQIDVVLRPIETHLFDAQREDDSDGMYTTCDLGLERHASG